MSSGYPRGFEAEIVGTRFAGGVLSSYVLALEAVRRGLRVELKPPRLTHFAISDGSRTVNFNFSRPLELTSDSAFAIVNDKFATITKLKQAGIPVPQSQKIDARSCDVSTACTMAAEIGYPIVLKPLTGSKGRGVLVGLANEEELRSGYEWLVGHLGVRQLLLESFVRGFDYRIYVVGGKVVAACERIPANVTGNGSDSVADLVLKKNRERARNPFLASGPIRRDKEVDDLLRQQGLDWESCPQPGVSVTLRRAANASAGGDVIDRTDDLPERIKDAAIGAVDAIPDLAAAGVDVLWDPSLSEGQDFAVIELNARAHIGVNMYPSEGRGRDIPSAILDAYFPDSRRLTVPGLSHLRLDIASLAVPLQSGAAEGVVLRAVPELGFPVRKAYSFGRQVTTLRPGAQRAIRTLSRRSDVSGYFLASKGLLVLAGGEHQVRAVRTEMEKRLGIEVKSERHWDGPFELGFTFR